MIIANKEQICNAACTLIRGPVSAAFPVAIHIDKTYAAAAIALYSISIYSQSYLPSSSGSSPLTLRYLSNTILLFSSSNYTRHHNTQPCFDEYWHMWICDRESRNYRIVVGKENSFDSVQDMTGETDNGGLIQFILWTKSYVILRKFSYWITDKTRSYPENTNTNLEISEKSSILSCTTHGLQKQRQ